MPTPSWLTYRTPSSSGQGLKTGDIKDRWLACLAALVSGTNPDGTTRGS